MNSNLKKALGFLLVAGALACGLSVIAYVNNNPSDNPGSDTGTDKPSNPVDVFKFKPLEFLDNLSQIFGSNSYNNSGSYEMKVNKDNVKNYINSTDFLEIENVINTGAQGLASEGKYNLKYFDVYSIRETAKTNESDQIYGLTFRFRYKLDCSQSNDTFNYYTYTKNTATKNIGYKADVSITGVDIDLILDSKTNSFINVLDYTLSRVNVSDYTIAYESNVEIYNDSFTLRTIDFVNKDFGSSFYILDDGSAVELTKMYNDPVERLSFYDNDIYPDMCYNTFFTSKKIEEVTPDNPLISKPSYEKDSYTNREKNILRFIHGDLNRCVGGFYDISMNGLTPVLNIATGKDKYEIIKYTNTASLIYRGKFAVNVNGQDDTIEMLMKVNLKNLDNLDDIEDDGDIISSVELYELKIGTYRLMLTASGDNITYGTGYSNLTFIAYDMVIKSNVKEEIYMIDKYYSETSNINNVNEIKFDNHDFDDNPLISQTTSEGMLVLKQLYENCDELDEIFSLFVSLC